MRVAGWSSTDEAAAGTDTVMPRSAQIVGGAVGGQCRAGSGLEGFRSARNNALGLLWDDESTAVASAETDTVTARSARERGDGKGVR